MSNTVDDGDVSKAFQYIVERSEELQTILKTTSKSSGLFMWNYDDAPDALQELFHHKDSDAVLVLIPEFVWITSVENARGMTTYKIKCHAFSGIVKVGRLTLT
jgi:hypothetical protein